MALTMSLSNGKKAAAGNAGGYETEYDDDEEQEDDDDEIEVVATQLPPTARPTRQAAAEAKQRLGRTASALSVEGATPDDSLEGRALSELLQARAAVSSVIRIRQAGQTADSVVPPCRLRWSRISTPKLSSARISCR